MTDDAKVKLHELMGTLKTSAKHGSLKSQLKRVENQKVVPVPLPRYQKEKVREGSGRPGSGEIRVMGGQGSGEIRGQDRSGVKGAT